MITDEQKKAIISAEIAVTNNPTNFELHIELGWAYFHAERLNEAMAAFQRAVALNPSAAGAFNGIGRVYERLGPVQAALEAYEHAIVRNRNVPTQGRSDNHSKPITNFRINTGRNLYNVN